MTEKINHGEYPWEDSPSARRFPKTQLYTRDQDHISLWRHGATTHIIFTRADFEKYAGKELSDRLLNWADDDITAIAIKSREEPATSYLKAMDRLNLTKEDIVERTDLSVGDVETLLNPRYRNNTDLIIKMCDILELNPITVGFV
jgi:hypothetical protein